MLSNSVIHNSVTDDCWMNKIGAWVGHVRHTIRNNVKVKKSKFEVTRSRDVVAQKTSIISRKHHPIVEMHLSPLRMVGQIFDRNS